MSHAIPYLTLPCRHPALLASPYFIRYLTIIQRYLRRGEGCPEEDEDNETTQIELYQQVGLWTSTCTVPQAGVFVSHLISSDLVLYHLT